MADTRPPHFPPGTPIGDHYTVEGLVRLSEGRMFYLANDVRPERPTRRCWECGHDDTPRSAYACAKCGAPFQDRRFLISSRWDEQDYDVYESYFRRGFEHPGLAAPVDIFRFETQFLSVIPYNGEGLMVDEAAPLSNQRVLDIAQRITGTLAYLHINGVKLRHLMLANLLISPDNSVRLFDLDVERVQSKPLEVDDRAEELKALGYLLRRYCNVESDELTHFMSVVENGEYGSPGSFGRMVQKDFERYAAEAYMPLLGAMSDVGLTRQLNEDNWGWIKLSDRSMLYVVADGMGGHDGGEVASELAVTTICRVAKERQSEDHGLDEVEHLLEDAFQTANNTIKEQAELKGNDMGTTLVSALVLEQKVAFLANVGDSRAYLLRKQSLHQVSKDHSLVAKMVERGRITAEEARTHPHSNILLRTVGTERDVDIDIFRVDLEPGDKVLMCSDGLWGEVEDRDIESILNTYPDPRIASRELVRAAHHGGGKDNVTLLIVQLP